MPPEGHHFIIFFFIIILTYQCSCFYRFSRLFGSPIQSVYNRDPLRTKTWFSKGAPEVVLKTCFAVQTRDGRLSMTEKMRRNFMGQCQPFFFTSILETMPISGHKCQHNTLRKCPTFSLSIQPKSESIFCSTNRHNFERVLYILLVESFTVRLRQSFA